ncbi:unnamed protein product [Leptidea sinapis]|uniref:Uncharacterized protein n=1 Tax=Leptidea sinapis TaxID=189913 RepID=A0A5E4PV96_9NEOP|nr:unnamed protein product [Leptidea sinapis]
MKKEPTLAMAATMTGPLVSRLLLLLTLTCLCAFVSCDKSEDSERKLQLVDGVTVNIPATENETGSLLSFDIDLNENVETGRGKRKNLMQKLMPMFILPFVIQSTIVPLFLGMLKFMLVKSLMIGKLALVLIIINAFRNSNSFRNRDNIASIHYGFNGQGMEEYGAYINK